MAIEAMPDHTDLHFELALCARAEGDLETAERLAATCLELGDAPARYASVAGSGTYLALCLLGEIAERRGHSDEAEGYYLRSLRDHPDYVAPVLPAAALMLGRDADLAQLRAALPLERPSATLLAATACLEANRLGEADELFLEVRADNSRAHGLYRRRGFEEIGVRRGYYQPSGADAIVMRKDLRR